MAAFALDVALQSRAQDSADAGTLIAWARERLIMRHRPSDDFDRHWHHAAIAFLEHRRNTDDLDRELDAATKQIPSDPRFVLARGVAAEQRIYAALAEGKRPPGSQVRAAEAHFRAATVFEPTRGEANLRLGYLASRLERDVEALQYFEIAAPLVEELGLRYLVRLFRGWTLTSLQRMDAADEAYESALRIVPWAQSATLGRASLLLRRRERGRADALVNDLITRRETPADPWWMYLSGDARFLSSLVDALHQDFK